MLWGRQQDRPGVAMLEAKNIKVPDYNSEMLT
jgi:hypothetical protein